MSEHDPCVGSVVLDHTPSWQLALPAAVALWTLRDDILHLEYGCGISHTLLTRQKVTRLVVRFPCPELL